VLLAAASSFAAEGGPFRIEVVDEATGRGVPMVELRAVSQTAYVTDSAGVVAFDEPALMDKPVFFTLKSHGYEYPADGFGFRGKTLTPTRGGAAVLKIRRVNIAERLYRITGEGIYRDTLLTGGKAPIAEPLLNSQVTGQDGAMAIPYRGRIFWTWGDTNRASYPLGNFKTTAATSLPPGRGGLDPSVGIDLAYFKRDDGFVKEACPIDGPGLVWMGGLATALDGDGAERLVGGYVRVKGLESTYERGLAVWNDEKEVFEKLRAFPVDGPVFPSGHAFRAEERGVEYWYFGDPFPVLRVPARLDKLTEESAYEAFTCLREGAKYDESGASIDWKAGRARWAWKRLTPPLTPAQEAELVKAGKLAAEDALYALRDARTGERVQAHAGSVRWNAWRKRWVAVVEQQWGTPSMIGEIWYAEAPTPLGPWAYAVKVVTHDKMSFYNPTQDDWADQDGGRLVYFEGTYSASFAGDVEPTPRYDYNQTMYRLALDDPRLALPQPVTQDGAVAFFAPDRRGEGLVPIPSADAPQFYALPPDADPRTGAPLYARKDGGWSLDAPSSDARPVARVWPTPTRVALPPSPTPLPSERR
jgi:hypothetical protein